MVRRCKAHAGTCRRISAPSNPAHDSSAAACALLPDVSTNRSFGHPCAGEWVGEPSGLMKSLILPLLALVTSTQAADLTGDFKGPLGLQLYTLRESFKTNCPATLDKVKALGF